MSYEQDKLAEENTRRFFRKKYGFFWKRKMNPKKKDWILVDEYYDKFCEFVKGEKDE